MPTTPTPTPFSGGCQCGAIRYESTALPGELQMFKCHCRDCQHVSGGPFTAVVYMPAHRFRITRGEIRYHHTTSESGGQHKRGFCPDCGSRLTGGEGPGSTGVGVTAASLDDPSWFRAQCEFFTADAQPWDPLTPGIPHFEKLPPA